MSTAASAASGGGFTVLIPARMASSRLPDKPLADIAGLPMVVRVARRAAASHAKRTVVAADDARIVDACRQHGVEAILTRSDERALAEGKKADMAARGKIMNGEGVDLVVSVHMNKFTDPSVHGPMAFYMKGSAEGEKLAKTVIDSITDELGAPRRIANPGDYYVIRESMPVSVLVECGFLSNSGDEALLQQEQHQKKLAHAIARGIFSYFEGDLGRKPLD